MMTGFHNGKCSDVMLYLIVYIYFQLIIIKHLVKSVNSIIGINF